MESVIGESFLMVFSKQASNLHSLDNGSGGGAQQVPRILVADFDDGAAAHAGGQFGGSYGSDDAHARLVS